MPIYQGTQFSKAIQFRQRSDDTPLDISTWEFEATFVDVDGETVLVASTGGGHFELFDPENGWVRLKLTAPQTEALPLGRIKAAVLRTDDDDGPIRFGRIEATVSEVI